jgi:nitrile hydratase subunit beta
MAARFSAGDRVTVKAEFRPGHVRTPMYIRGKTGVIASLQGAFRNPEKLAYGGDGLPLVPLYYVIFPFHEVFGDTGESRHDTVAVDIYEHWLEPA